MADDPDSIAPQPPQDTNQPLGGARTDNDDSVTNNPQDTNQMHDLEGNQQQPQDFATPFSPPPGVQDRIDDTHPATDTNINEHERYDAGIEAASGVDLPGQAADEDQGTPR